MPISPSTVGMTTESMLQEYTFAEGVTLSRVRGMELSLRARGDDLVDAALHVEVALGDVVELANEDHLEAANGLLDRYVFGRGAGEDFGHGERLRKEALDFAGAIDGLLVLGRELVGAEDGDDVLKILVALEDALHFAGDVVVLLADDVDLERLRDGGERINRGINAEFGNGAVEHDGGIKVGEGVRRRRVGEIVRGHVDGLHGGDGAFLRRGDALLEEAHLVGEGRLVTDRGGRAAEQRGDLGAGLREAEDVVDKEQHVLALLVAEILGHRECRKRDAHAGARRLVHLAVDQRDLRFAQVLLVDDAGLRHLVVKVVALAGTLADAGKHRVAAMRLGDIVNELENDDGLADARAAERPGLAALDEGADEVDDLDAGLENLGLGVLIDQRGSRAVNGVTLGVRDRALAIHRFAGDIEDAAEHPVAHGDGDGRAGVGDIHAADEAFGGGHGDGAHDARAEVLLDLEGEILLHASGGGGDG